MRFGKGGIQHSSAAFAEPARLQIGLIQRAAALQRVDVQSRFTGQICFGIDGKAFFHLLHPGNPPYPPKVFFGGI